MADKNNDQTDNIFLEGLQEEIDKINKNIKILIDRRNSLAAIMQAKKEGIIKSKSKIGIKSSKRCNISLIIKDFINFSNREVKCNEIYDHISSSGISIKDSTIRTYLSYLKKDGIIIEGNKRGYWKINHD